MRGSAHIKDYEQYEVNDETSGEDEKILRFQPLVFHCPAYTLVDGIRSHLEEERAENGSGDDEEDTGTEPRGSGLACVGIA